MKSKIKFVIICVCLIANSIHVSAYENNKTTPILERLEKQINKVEPQNENIKLDIVSISVENDDIIIKHQGMSEFPNVFGICADGTEVLLTKNQVDDVGFLDRLTNSSSSGFYDNYTRTLDNETIIMPKYGNDCSGFLSFAWNIPRQTTTKFVNGIKNGTYKKVGNYNANAPTYSDLHNSYKYLQKGDALVKNGHTFFVIASSEDFGFCYCYEQTPYYAIASYWDYEDLASQGYMPFGKY